MAEPRGTLTDHVVVCGLDHLGLRTIEELRLGGEAVVGIGSAEPVVEAAERLDRRHAGQRRPAPRGGAPRRPCRSAVAIVLTGENDLANVHAALAAQELNPAIRIVLRMFDPELGNQIEALFPNAVALSSSALAAPGFVSAALDGDGGATFLLAGHRVSTRLRRPRRTRRRADPATTRRPLATIPIATLQRDRTVDLLPPASPSADAAAADVADGRRSSSMSSTRWTPPSERARRSSTRRSRRTGDVVAGVGGGIRALPSRLRGGLARPPRIRAERRLVRFGAVLLGLAVVSALYFELTAGLAPLDAFSYAITLLTGAAIPTSLDPTPRRGRAEALRDRPLDRRRGRRRGRLRPDHRRDRPVAAAPDARPAIRAGRRSRDHVIVVGLGSIGHRVALDVAARGRGRRRRRHRRGQPVRRGDPRVRDPGRHRRRPPARRSSPTSASSGPGR